MNLEIIKDYPILYQIVPGYPGPRTCHISVISENDKYIVTQKIGCVGFYSKRNLVYDRKKAVKLGDKLYKKHQQKWSS